MTEHANPTVCSSCPAVCCRMPAPYRTKDRWKQFPLSGVEAERLHACMPALRLDTWPNEARFVSLMHWHFPSYSKQVTDLFELSGSHTVLPLNKEGACCFLSLDPERPGCVLPLEARPHFCRLFPLWIKQDAFMFFTSTRCPVTRQEPNVPAMLAAVNLTVDKARWLYLSLLNDWGMI